MKYSPFELQQLIRKEIPPCDAMEVCIEELTPSEIRVSAPMTANKNNHGSFFAGSIYSLSAITGWGLLTAFAHDQYPGSGVVVRKGSIDYLRPIDSERLEIQCQLPIKEKMLDFIRHLEDKGKARLSLEINLYNEGQLAVIFQGTYTVLTAETVAMVQGKGK